MAAVDVNLEPLPCKLQTVADMTASQTVLSLIASLARGDHG